MSVSNISFSLCPAGVVEAPIPTENQEVFEHHQYINSDASQLQQDTVADVLEPSDIAAEIGPQVTCLSDTKAAEAADTVSAAKELLAYHKNGGLGSDGDIMAAEDGAENMVHDVVLLKTAQNSATVEIATSSEDIAAENVNPSFADKGIGTEKPNTDASYDETNMHMLDDSIEAGDYPCKKEGFSYNMMGVDVTNANPDLCFPHLLYSRQDLDYSAAGNDACLFSLICNLCQT
ncbi:hypothetical protein BC332_25266 [Capsicum chinense]|nr:hypothetical protein BC332_25266 [Capsicum chinense]